MSWTPLRTNYKDLVWIGNKKYTQINNDDGSVSFLDITQYTNKDDSFYGALDANKVNEGINHIMISLEGGTNLYTEFLEYFNNQKTQFESNSNTKLQDFQLFLDGIKQTAESGYESRIVAFENNKKIEFETWFNLVKAQLSTDAAGNLQNQINTTNSVVENHTLSISGLQSSVDSINSALPNKQPRNTRQALTITTDDWLPYSVAGEEWTKKKEIAIEGITAEDVPQLNFARDCKVAATDAGVTQVETEAGKLVLYAESVPSKTLTAELLLHKA